MTHPTRLAVLLGTAAALTATAVTANAATPGPATAPQTRLVVRATATDPDGTTHTRYDRTYAGLPVLGGDIVVHQRPDGTRTTTGNDTPITVPLPRATPTPTPTPAPGRATRQVIWAAAATPATLAWETITRTTHRDGTPSELHTVTDARTGGTLATYDTVASGIGHSQHAGTVPLTTYFTGSLYQLRDTTRGNQRTLDAMNQPGGGTLFTDPDDTWGNGTPTNRQSAGVDAHYATAVTWDFYKGVFGRNGIRGDGVGVVSRVHYGSNYPNAFWDGNCGCANYGNDPATGKTLATLDIVGHELTHGVTASTAGLMLSGESGALNEATSDILGTAAEFSAENTTDVGDYLIGEKAFASGPLRTMDRPSLDGHSRDYWSRDIGGIDPHYASGPARHFFYLLAEGSGPKVINKISYDSPTYDGSKLLGIGRDAATRIWYRALTLYMTSTTNYSGARRATLQAAGDLYGPSSAEAGRVAAAWTAVNVR
ncbi:M4 family metallopeptidase [Streptomyces sp. NPDC048340]|uniref:M4 family metallopeptidase n=1 Tax=Streptomyces sp. NPDC048340 TaxID=3365537 RepID=UPI00371DC1B3